MITLIEKKDRNKRLIKNWRPISLINVDTKNCFQGSSNKDQGTSLVIKRHMLTLFSMGYLKNTTVWGSHYGPPPNFVVSGSIIIKFGVLIEFDKFSPK